MAASTNPGPSLSSAGREFNPRAALRTLFAALASRGVYPPGSEPELRRLPDWVRSGDVALDIGANVGLYTGALSRIVGPSGRVLSYEPYPDSVRWLSRLVRWLGARNVTVTACALSDRAGTGRMELPPRVLGGRLHGLAKLRADGGPAGAGPSVPVELCTLDAEVERHRLGRLDFIKCDAEGAEWAIFHGGAGTVRRFRPTILCEVEASWASGSEATVAERIEYLRRLGDYRVDVCEGGSTVPLAEARERHSNYLFRRPEKN